ncbi:MAG: hypothetical protein J4F41_00065 [Alphaproteobacteria bacterium]|nr:hypothetical protein [Alphaproteobacteria bacterium]
MGKIHAATIQKSPRLQRLLAALGDGGWHTTRELMLKANVMAVGTCVSELRDNGLTVECRCRGKDSATGAMIYEYRISNFGKGEITRPVTSTGGQANSCAAGPDVKPSPIMPGHGPGLLQGMGIYDG